MNNFVIACRSSVWNIDARWLKERLRNLDLEPDGLWADAKADFRRIAGELASGFERWIELLDDARQETQHWR
jgi:hypothetical protein